MRFPSYSIATTHGRPSRVHWLALLVPFCVALVVNAAPVDLGPPDPASPSAQQLRPEESGAYSVNPQSGAATYTYPFTLPPARGFAPSLSLSYTSNGPTRGDIAQGWSLGPIPVIRRDVQREVSPNTPQYTAYFGGAIQELIKIDAGLDAFLLPPGASSVESYRAVIARDFTRFEHVTVPGETGNSHYWIAFAPDGKTSYFGDDVSNVAGDASSRFGEEYYLTRVVDRWGNTVSYHYQTVTDPTNAPLAVDRVLSSISYSANPGANLPDHAQVLLTWQTPARCATDSAWGGQGLPVGASLDYSIGARRIRGAKQLTSISMRVRDTPTSAWREVHAYSFQYDASRETCEQLVHAHRLLAQIVESGTILQHGVSTTTPGPTVTFQYGIDRGTLASTAGIRLPLLVADARSSAAGQAKYGLSLTASSSPISPTYAMLLDMDGDGLPDLVQATGAIATTANGVNATCTAVWYTNQGGTFDLTHPHTLLLPQPPMPHLPDNRDGSWFVQNLQPVGSPPPGVSWETEGECSLAGAFFAVIQQTSQKRIRASQSTLYYRWVDMDNDGKVDLVAQLYQDREPTLSDPVDNLNAKVDRAAYPSREASLDGFACGGPTQNPDNGDSTAYSIRLYRNVGGALDITWQQWCAPVAFAGLPTIDVPPNPRITGRLPDPSKLLFDIVDLNGDKLPDLVTRSFNGESTSCGASCGGWCPTAPSGQKHSQLNVFVNNGQVGHARVRTPTSVPMVIKQSSWPDNTCAGEITRDSDALDIAQWPGDILDGFLVDANSDGLPDLFTGGPTEASSPRSVIYNAGGFTFDTPSRTLLGAFDGPVTRQQIGPAAFRDLDGDGLIDFSCMDGINTPGGPSGPGGCSHTLGQGILFGNGGGYDVSSSRGDFVTDPNYTYGDAGLYVNGYPPTENLGLTARVSETDGASDFGLTHYMRRVWRDYIDLDGDGVPERYVIHATSANNMVDNNGPDVLERDWWRLPPDSAPSLLTQVTNGVGGTITFHYTRSTDPTVVHYSDPSSPAAYSSGWGDFIRPSVRPLLWVVKRVDVDDGQGTVASTPYEYYDPVVAPSPIVLNADRTVQAGPRSRFRGFQAVVTALPTTPGAGPTYAPFTFQRYTYVHDPDGLPDYTTFKEHFVTGWQQATVTRTAYEDVPLLGGAIKAVRPTSTTQTECRFSIPVTSCDTQTAFTRQTTFNYQAWPPNGNAQLYVTSSTVENDGLTARRHDTDFQVLDQGGDFLVLPTARHDYAAPVISGGGQPVWTLNAHEEYFFDGSNQLGSLAGFACGAFFGASCKGTLTKKRVYRAASVGSVTDPSCNDDTTCVDYGYWYDGIGALVGNRTRAVRPRAMQSSGAQLALAPATTYEYAWPYLAPLRTTNERAQQVQDTYDLGTGLLVDQLGPDFRAGALGTKTVSWAEHAWTYDGLGRLLSVYAPYDTGSAYALHLTQQVVYDAFPSNVVTTQSALDWDWNGQSGSAMAVRQHYDGLSRLVLQQVSLDGQTFSDAANPLRSEDHAYSYDIRGNLVAITIPDPSTTTAATVTYYFAYDNRGRVLQVRAPDGATTQVTYTPWAKTATDADGGITRDTFDGYGALLSVDEYRSDTAHATTSYRYDGAGRLAAVVDADTQETTLAHDLQGNRIQIVRPGGRVWTYHYDADANLTQTQDPDRRVVTYTYNALDRLLTETSDFTAALAQHPTLLGGMAPGALGIGQIVYQYDGAGNSVGRLSGASFYGQGETAPYTIVTYEYDAAGNPTSTCYELRVSQTGNQAFCNAVTFGPQGQKIQESYPNGQVATWTYDHRGHVSTVVTAGSNVTTQYTYGHSGALATKTGIPPSQAQPPQQHTYSYDSRSHLLTDTLAVQGWHLNRTYSYTAAGDMHTLALDDAVADGTLHTTMTFGYDGLHRLTAADASTGVAYHAQLTYRPSGSIDHATVTGQLVGLPQRSAVAYGYDATGAAADVQAVTALTASDGATLAQFLYDKSGNMTARQHTMEATYLYDAHDQLRQVESPSSSGTWERYYYDHNRRRFLALASNGSWRFYIGDAYEMDHYADGTSRQNSYVIANGEAVMRVAACSGTGCQSAVPATTFLHHDRRGDLLASFDLNGTVQSHFAYGAFGELLSKYETAPSEWRRRFNEKEQDQIDGLSYYGYRYFDPLTLQWTSIDPLYRFTPEVGLAGGRTLALNLYSLSMNNPLTYRDIDGRFAESHLEGPPASQFGPNVWCEPDTCSKYMGETLTNARRRQGQSLGLSGQYLSLFAKAGSADARQGVYCAFIGGCRKHTIGSQWSDVPPPRVVDWTSAVDAVNDVEVAAIVSSYLANARGSTLGKRLENAWQAAENNVQNSFEASQDIYEAAAKHFLMTLYFAYDTPWYGSP